MPKISVCISVYNTEKYIEDCLLSVMCQSLPPDEIIVVDDCSTDSTVPILQRYEDKINFSQTPENCGSAFTRNQAAAAAEGEYIKFFDGDDLLLYTALESLYNKVIETKADVVVGNGRKYMLYCPPKEHRVWKENPTFRYGGVEEQIVLDFDWWDNRKLCYELKQKNIVPGGSPLVKRSVFELIGGFDASLRSAEDWDLWNRLAISGYKFAKCSELIYIMRGHENEKTVLDEQFCCSQAHKVWTRYNKEI